MQIVLLRGSGRQISVNGNRVQGLKGHRSRPSVKPGLLQACKEADGGRDIVLILLRTMVQLCPWGLPGCPAVRPVWAVGTLTCAGCRARGSQDSPHTAVAGSLRHTCSCCSDSGPGRCTPPAGYSDSPRWTSGTGRRSPRSQACNCIGHSHRSPSLENNRDHQSSLPCRRLGTGSNPPAILCPSLVLPCKEDCSYSLLSFY